MRVPWLLQRYISRELGKTFLLAVIGLTIVMSLGGGLFNMIRFGDVTPVQFGRLLLLLVPLAAAMTLPVAALFSAASTYGRLSADNEFVACRASGINLQVLFLPTMLLSTVAAGVCFLFISFVIPGMVRNLNQLFVSDVDSLIRRQLRRPQGFSLGRSNRVYADEAAVDPADPGRILLDRVAFVERDGEEWVRYGTARRVEISLDRSSPEVRIAGRMLGMGFFDRRLGRFADSEEQIVPTNVVPLIIPPELKYLTMTELLRYRAEPDSWHEVAEAVDRVRMHIARRRILDELEADWSGGDRTITLTDNALRYTLTSATMNRLPRDAGLELTGVYIEEVHADRRRTGRAERAAIEVTRAGSLEEVAIKIDVYDAAITLDGQTVERSSETFGPVAVSPAMIHEIGRTPVTGLLGSRPAQDERDPVTEAQAEAVKIRGEVQHRIAAILNERTAYAASVFVLVILAAALGIIFRGSQMVIAFGISFLPSVLVIITIVMGRQMAQNAATHVPGMLVMWSGIAIAGVLDLWILTRVVRR